MLLRVIVIVFTWICFASAKVSSSDGKAPNLPEYLNVCHRSDPNLEKCIIKAVEAMRPYLKKGIPEFGVPKFEPLHIPELIINQGNGAITLKSKYSDIVVNGPSQFEVKNVSTDFDNDRVHLELLIPSLQTRSGYSMTGRILILPISGKGQCSTNYTDIQATCVIQGEKFQKDGQTFWNIKDLFLDFEIGHAVIKMYDLFNGNQELGNTMNTFLNENWKNVAEEIKPTFEKAIGDIVKKLANNIFHKYPLDTLLPP